MQTQSPPNRRLVARSACGLTVAYRRGKDWHPATAVDISSRGCRLRLGEDLPRSGAVSVRLECARRADREALVVEAEGRVVWSRLEGLSYQAGIQFVSEPASLAELLSRAG